MAALPTGIQINYPALNGGPIVQILPQQQPVIINMQGAQQQQPVFAPMQQQQRHQGRSANYLSFPFGLKTLEKKTALMTIHLAPISPKKIM